MEQKGQKVDSFFLKKKKKEVKLKKHIQQSVEECENQNGDNSQKINENKKPFDKKLYRLKKYSKKYKLEKWDDQRKKKLLRNYYKENKHMSDTGLYSAKTFDEDNDTQDGTNAQSFGRYVRHPDLIENEKSEEEIANKEPFRKGKEKYNKIKQEKMKKQKEYEQAKEEKKAKLQEHKQKKQELYKKLSKKTKKGQPVMSGRLEHLLEKIQKKF